ncbi:MULTISPECIES: hypothetical protein [Bacillaceae]|uniref:Uncharacterized protein n=2 Tax=Bacillaceae TaxID=186817 RepID=A0A856MBP5_9BACI|nr:MULTISPECIES: hypothetical protein [Bacillaceae]GAK78777.1 hypothetical protein BSMD_006780 [Bacillus subtilis Miyagi-4]AMK74801.1 hypothetical protein AWV81_22150 [Bacillus subtilis subsp. natto]API45192.1 hypothetical protein BSR08_22645 [Bacillus subtilis]API98482.1 hypothetical protein BKP58_22035 [Bacillus subtilis]ASB72328.1 hypothetical protein S100333_04469 [Bacillus subtilis subsp. subtilis]
MLKKIPANEENAEKKIVRQKKLFIVICIVFIGAMLLYFMGGSNKEKVTKNEQKESLIEGNSSEQSTYKSSVVKEEKAEDKDKQEMQQTLKSFIESYYSYDYKNKDKHLKESKKYLTPEFYKELSLAEENNTKVQPFAYRKVQDISYSGFSLVNGKPHWIASVNAELLDDKRKVTGTIEVEFELDLNKREDNWTVTYFAVTGKGLKENE